MSTLPSIIQSGLRGLIRHNPLFLVSALLLLVGAWLVNPPAATGGRERENIVPLLFAVQGYELTLLGAAWLLARRGLVRDVRNLVLVLAPFLLDVSCTNALAAEETTTWPGHALAVGTLLALVGAKAAVAARLLGRVYDRGAWAALLAGPVAVALLPIGTSFLAHRGASGDELALAGGLALAGLALTVGWGAGRAADVRLLAPISLGVAGWHVLGTAWSHSGSLLLVVGPTLAALGVALPRLAWPTVADKVTPLVLPALGALCCGLPGLDRPEPFLGLSAWQTGLLALGAIHGFHAARQGTLPFVLGVLAAIDLAAGGATLAGSLAHVGRGAAEPLALFALFAWGLARRAPAPALAVPLLLGAALTYRLHPVGRAALDAVLALDLVGAGLLAWTHRVHGTSLDGARARFAGALLLLVPIHVEAAWGPYGEAAAPGLARATLAALLALGLATRLRVYALPGLLLPLEAARGLAPGGAAGWGALGIAGAFGLVAAGVAVSLQRERLLAWLEAEPRDEDEAPAPIAARTFSLPAALGVIALATFATALFAQNAHASTDHRARSRAVGALKTIQTAQTLFREGDKDRDGVPDYARALSELGRARLIDEVLASGVKSGYRFSITVAPDAPEFLWMAVAAPLDPGPDRPWLVTNHTGVIQVSPTPVELNPRCALPQPPLPVGR